MNKNIKTANLANSSNTKTGTLVILILAVCAMVLIAHWPALSANALSFDDEQYMVKNMSVQNPSFTSAKKFLTEVLEPSTVGGYYQPLTMISLMFDSAMGGKPNNLMPFHRTSLFLHTINTALIIILLWSLFGNIWAAVAVGLLFGTHPMTVETIPWIGERKTLLAAFFSLWSLILYIRYAKTNNSIFYVACIIAYILALMSKPTSTPLPLAMLLIDFWPLKRLNKKAILEKLPFLAIGLVSAVITIISQGRTAGTELAGGYQIWKMPLVICYDTAFYMYKMICPINLSSHYAFPDPLSLSNPKVLACFIGALVIAILLIISFRWTHGVLTGWLIFFITILPTMQIMRFSNVIASDKFAYLPSIGLLMALTAFLIWLNNTYRTKNIRQVIIIIFIILVCAETVATRRYLTHWRDTASLCRHMLKLTPNAQAIHVQLGAVLESQGKTREAVSHYMKALQVKPDNSEAINNLGVILAKQGKLGEAVMHFNRALQIRPFYAEAYFNLANVSKAQNKIDEAIGYYQKALQINPNYYEAHNNLGVVLKSQKRLDEAISHYRQALKINPKYVSAHNNLGNALLLKNRVNEAISHYRQSLQIKPDDATANRNLNLILRSKNRPN